MINIILIGFMGCGKSTFGKWLAEKQQMDFVDTDEFIEKLEGCTVSGIFAKKGEEYFRQLETKVLKMFLGEKEAVRKETDVSEMQEVSKKYAAVGDYCIRRSTVISVGGGLPVREENQKLLHKLGKVVFLDTEVDELVKRLEGDTTRPLLAGADLRERIEKLMDDRLNIYEDTADIIVGTDDKSMHEIYEELMKEWEFRN